MSGIKLVETTNCKSLIIVKQTTTVSKCNRLAADLYLQSFTISSR